MEDMDDPAWVRSQGVGWIFSRCNTESGGSFGCATCHDPHKSARADHDLPVRGEMPLVPSRRPESIGHDRGAWDDRRAPVASRPCPVNPAEGCVRCHMPPVRIDSLHLYLSDHDIRIHRPKP